MPSRFESGCEYQILRGKMFTVETEFDHYKAKMEHF